MQKAIVPSLVVIALIIGGMYYRKYAAAKRLKVGLADFQLNQKLVSIDSLTNLSSTVNLTIDNFSSQKFNIQQSKIELYTTTGELIASQNSPLSNSTELQANKKNLFRVPIDINPQKALKMVQDQGGIGIVLANKFTTGEYGLDFVIKGFVKANGVVVNINETVSI